MTRGCIFCQATGAKLTREHVFPAWVSNVLASDPRGLPPSAAVRVHSGGRVVHTVTGTRALEAVTKRVCKGCNEGWLETTIESPAKDRITRMILGVPVFLDPVARARVAAWIAKTVMVARYIHYPADPLPQAWLTWMYQRHEVPDGWYVWATKYDGQRPFFYDGHDITLQFPDRTIETPHGLLATLVIGHLAVKVLGIRRGQATEPDARLLVRLAPTAERLAAWPPPESLDDTSLPDFVNMYLDSPGVPAPALPQ